MPGWICVALLSRTLTQLSRKAQTGTARFHASGMRQQQCFLHSAAGIEGGPSSMASLTVTMPLATAAGASSAVRGVTALNCAASYQMMPSRSRLQFRSPLACHACNLMGKSSLKCHRHPYSSNEPCCIELLDLRIRWEGPRYVWWAPADLLSCGVASLPASEFEHQLFEDDMNWSGKL